MDMALLCILAWLIETTNAAIAINAVESAKAISNQLREAFGFTTCDRFEDAIKRELF